MFSAPRFAFVFLSRCFFIQYTTILCLFFFKLFIKSYLRKLSVELGSALLLGCDLDQRFRYKKTSTGVPTEDTREVVVYS